MQRTLPSPLAVFLAPAIGFVCATLGACEATTRTAAPSVEPVRSGVPDGINDRFLDPRLSVDDWVARWEVESREIYTQRHAIVDAIELEPGDRIADVGAGTGLFMASFSRAVGPSGRVFAVEIAPVFAENLRNRARDERFENVEVILSTEISTELPRGSVDVAFACDTYHHFTYHMAMLESLRDAIREGGKLAIVDFERIPGVSRDWILGHVRAGKSDVIAEIEAAGFVLESVVEIDGLRENYMVLFRRP